MRRIVIDTNVIVSAAIRTGYSFKLLHDVIPNEKIKLCLSEDILNEYWRVSVYARIRKKYPDYTEKMNLLIEAIQEVGVLYFPSQKFTILKDLSDNKFIDLAHEAKADYIITGNKNDFSIQQFEQTKIVTPKEFFELYEANFP